VFVRGAEFPPRDYFAEVKRGSNSNADRLRVQVIEMIELSLKPSELRGMADDELYQDSALPRWGAEPDTDVSPR
jgi:hypothetical protein